MHNNITDDNVKKDNTDIPLGSGVDILQPKENDDGDDVEIESYNGDAEYAEGMTPQDRIKHLREKLRECTKDKQEYLDGWQRLKADFVNFKKRNEEEKEYFLKFSREGIITDLLPVLESFNMAFANKEAWGKVDPSWRIGIEHIHTQLMQVLSGYGLTELNPIGSVFDPNEQMSIGSTLTNDTAKYHTVAEVLQVGYKLGGRLIKAPKVKIYGEATPDATSPPDKE
jgi:molecular chaperone GrpE (heat shock protein)